MPMPRALNARLVGPRESMQVAGRVRRVSLSPPRELRSSELGRMLTPGTGNERPRAASNTPAQAGPDESATSRADSGALAVARLSAPVVERGLQPCALFRGEIAYADVAEGDHVAGLCGSNELLGRSRRRAVGARGELA